MESFEVPITQSPEMVKRLGEETYSTPENAMDELVQNAYDSGASKIKITINESKIIFEDDGQGFNKERIIAFCTQGTNYKVKHNQIKGKAVAGNKGIGRYAIFKLSNLCEVRTKIDTGCIYSWTLNNTRFYAGNKCQFYKNSVLWGKENLTGTEFLMSSLTEAGRELKDRIERLKQLIIRNWDVESLKIYINGEKLKPEHIKYEKDYELDVDLNINENIVVGKIGLAEKEGQVNGVLIKVNGRGVGRPKLFGVDKNAKYGLLISRLRGVLHIDSFADIINISRDDFIKTKKYCQVKEKLRDKIILLLEKKLKHQEKLKNSKMNKLFKKILDDVNKLLAKIFKEKKGTFESLAGDYKEEKGEEAFKLEDGNTRPSGGEGHIKPQNEGKDIVGVTEIKKYPNKLRIGKYNYNIRMGSEGPGNKLIVVRADKREVVVNTDHPAFKSFQTEKTMRFLFLEIIYSATLEDVEFPNEKIREIIDETMRNMFIK